MMAFVGPAHDEGGLVRGVAAAAAAPLGVSFAFASTAVSLVWGGGVAHLVGASELPACAGAGTGVCESVSASSLFAAIVARVFVREKPWCWHKHVLNT